MIRYFPLSKIVYKNDSLVTPIKKVALFNLEQRYNNLFEVLNLPIKKDSKPYLIYLKGDSIKEDTNQIKKSGDWCFFGRLSKRERRLIDKIKNQK